MESNTVQTGSSKWLSTGAELEVSGFEIEGIGEVEGWKVFSKLKSFVKKVGKGVKKLTIKKVLGIAIPIVSAGLLPVASLPMASLVKKFGGGVAKKIKAGKTVLKAVKTKTGDKVAMISPAAAAKLSAMKIDIKTPVTEQLLQQVTGEPVSESIVEGTIQEGAAVLEKADEAKTALAGFAGGPGKMLLIAGLGVGALMMMRKKGR